MAETQQPRERRVDEDAGGPQALGAGGGGTNDVTSGGGAGGGIPDADTALRVGDVVNRGDPEADRKRLFPESASHDVGSHPGQNTPGDVDAGE